MAIPTDTLFSQQWYLLNNTVGELDLNIVDVWDDFTGAGVDVAVIDSGYDRSHADFDNFDFTRDQDFLDNDAVAEAVNASENHGTAVMGIIGAAADGTGSVGTAHGSTLIGYRMGFSGADFTSNWISAINQTVTDNVEILNMSIGYLDTFVNFSIAGAGNDTNELKTAVEAAIDNGRGGLGNILVKSAGNDRASNFDSNADVVAAERGAISVAAVDRDGDISSYSTHGAANLVSAFGSPGGSFGEIVTTDRTGAAGYDAGDHTSSFNGTSAAAPMVSGIVALMLEANPNLGWRDVQDILAYSARHVGTDIGSGTSGSEEYAWDFNGADDWNGGGLHFSNDYGFGLVDAKAAVRLAETWTLVRAVQTSANEVVEFEDILNVLTTITGSGSNTFTATPTNGDRIEFVEIDINFVALDDLGDLDITLESPDGTVSQIIDNTGENDGSPAGGLANTRWQFTSNAFRGENASGSWTLTISDQDSSGVSPITINDIDVRFFGSDINDRNYVFTDEFSDYAARASHGTHFTTSGFLDDVLNASAVDSDTTIDLFNGTGTIDGVAVTFGNSLEHVFTGDGADTVETDSAVDVVFTGRGNDFIGINQNISTALAVNGGAGTDTIDWSDSSQIGATFDLASETATNAAATITTAMEGFENINGTNQADTIIGTNDANIINGNGGDDTVFWAGGEDTIDGGDDNDTINGAEVNFGSSALFDLTNEIYTIGPAFSQSWLNFENYDNAASTSGNESVIGTSGNNTISTGGGANTITGNGGADTINAGDGDDTIIITAAGIVAGAAFNGQGGTGDTLDFSASSDSYVVDLEGGTFDMLGGGAASTTSGIERIVAGNGDDVLTGNQFFSQIFGGGGNDTIRLGTSMNAGSIFDGQGGTNTFDLSNSTDAAGYSVNLASGAFSFFSGAQPSMALNFTHVIGSFLSDTLIGNGLDNELSGGAGADQILGGSGADTIDGGTGADQMLGGDGDDTFIVDNAGDTVGENAGQGIDTVRSSVSFILGANIEHLTLTGSSAIDGLGNDLGNIIRGNDEANGLAGGNGGDLLIGGGGDDSLDGQNGADIMRGGAGSDGYNVDQAGDVIEEDFNGGEFDLVRTAITLTLPDNVEIAILKGGAANPISITGNDGAANDVPNLILGNDSVNTIQTFGGRDVILGRDGVDTINAGGGRDNIAGGGGADIITGGGGDDNFNYVSIGDAGDLITDFDISEVDVLDLRAMFDTFAGGGALDTNTAQAQGFLRLQDNGNSISVFADSDGSAGGNAEVLLALLNNVTDDVSVVDNFILV